MFLLRLRGPCDRADNIAELMISRVGLELRGIVIDVRLLIAPGAGAGSLAKEVLPSCYWYLRRRGCAASINNPRYQDALPNPLPIMRLLPRHDAIEH